MAQVFLSYDRADANRARPIALALEKAGHAVWWDPHIRGGEQFSKAIDEALSRADAVVVLWSAHSIDSTWVRDEAAAGRDSGRLVPVLIDAVQPPLGFRQYQSIDMSAWKGGGQPPRFQELLISLTAQSGGIPTVPATAHPSRPAFPALPWTRIIVGIAAVLILAAATLFVLRPRPDRTVQTVSVSAADPAAAPLARDLLVKLATLQSAMSGSMRLISQGQDARKPADLLFEVGGDTRAAKPTINLVLMTGQDRTVLWSDDLAEESVSLADLKLRAAFTSARVLGCVLEGLSPGVAPLSQSVLKLYLNACALLGETYSQDSSPVIPVLEKVTQQAPGFKPAWAKLLVAQTSRYQQAKADERSAIAVSLRRRIVEARKFDPQMPEAFLAELELLPAPLIYEQIKLVDQALKAGPTNPFVLRGRSLALMGVGRMEAAVVDARRAASLDPLSPAVRTAYIEALAYSGRTDAAKSELAEAERLWPGATMILNARYGFNLRTGDPADALRLIQSGAVEGSRTREAFLQARIRPTTQNVDRAIRLGMSNQADTADWIGEMIQVLGEFDKKDELFTILLNRHDPREIPYFVEALFRPAQADLRADPRFMLVASKFGLLDYWQRSGDWPDFCSDPDLPYNCKKEAAKLRA